MSSTAPTASENTPMLNAQIVRQHEAHWATGRILVSLYECGAYRDEYRVYWNGVLRYIGRNFAEAAKIHNSECDDAGKHDVRGTVA